MGIDLFIAQRVRSLRTARGLSLEQLAGLSGVSKSMISLIERGETSPTAAVLNKLADALSVSLPALFSGGPESAAMPVSRPADQKVWTDPQSGYVRRGLSPTGVASPIELVEVLFPPGKSVAFENATRSIATHQQMWVLEGEMTVSLGDETWSLHEGDCLAMVLGQQLVFHNPSRKTARYVLALTTLPAVARASQ